MVSFLAQKESVAFFSCQVSGFFQDPDVPVADWIPVILQLDASLTGVFPQLYFVMDDDTVVPDGHDWRITIFCRLKFHVIGLPAQRWKAHVFIRAFPRVKTAAFIGLAGQSEGIKHLCLGAKQIHSAIASSLSPCFGHIW